MYKICGYYYNSTRRFTMKTSNYIHAMGINLWKGNVYEMQDGKWSRIKSVSN